MIVFKKLLKNLDYLMKNKQQNTVVSIRINVDNSNANMYFETYSYIIEKFGKQVNVYLEL
jgi:sulfatase maturation enzyme AslB (radical SAM superfamily)